MARAIVRPEITASTVLKNIDIASVECGAMAAEKLTKRAVDSVVKIVYFIVRRLNHRERQWG